MQRRFFNWVALVGIALAGVVAVSAATALGARSAASPFALVVTAHDELVGSPDCWPQADTEVICQVRRVGTFTSGAPFCESGAADEGQFPNDGSTLRRYTCADGSGSLTLRFTRLLGLHNEVRSRWTIVEGSGRYDGMRGKGTSNEPPAPLDGAWPLPAPLPLTTTLQGIADWDTVAPSIAFARASARKLPGPAGAFSIRVALSLPDDVEGNPVTYKLKVTEGRRERATATGTTASGSISASLRVQPSNPRLRSIDLHVRASDPVGNEQYVVRPLKLPR